MTRRARTLATRWDAITTTIDLIRRDDMHRGLELADIDHEASYHTTPGGEGIRSSGPSDPTAARAGKHHPPNPAKQLDKLSALLDWFYDTALTGNTDPRSRPELGGPCRGGQTHRPDSHGNCQLPGCAKRWPCNPSEPEPWFEECAGQLAPDSERCPRCELHRDSWICRTCPDQEQVHPRTSKPRNGLCDRCRKRAARRQENAA